MKTVSKEQLKQMMDEEVVVKKEDKNEPQISIFIDPEMVGKGGIKINGKTYIGNITVGEGLAEDLRRIQAEYWETVKKMTNKEVRVRMKSDAQKESLFLADPEENKYKKNYSREFGLLPAEEWVYCSEPFKKYLLQTRKQIYGF